MLKFKRYSPSFLPLSHGLTQSLSSRRVPPDRAYPAQAPAAQIDVADANRHTAAPAPDPLGRRPALHAHPLKARLGDLKF